MSNFDSAGLALAAVCPNNKMILDDLGMPSFYVKHGAMKLSELIAGGDSSVHPAFRVKGVEQPSLYFGKYQGVQDGSRIYSLPGEDPKVYITLDNYTTLCRNKGKGHHCITAAEWAFLALWCKKNGTQPKGNNDYGKDSSESDYLAIPTYKDNGRTGRVATGTGPLTWRHNGQLDGICDLNGNVWEWCLGIRLVYGELQVIPYNNAADNDVDVSAASAQWKAIKAGATSWEDLFIAPNGSGTTSGSVKLNWVSGHFQWDTSITSGAEGSHDADFATTTASSGIGATAKMYLQAMALMPEDGAQASDYNGDHFWANTAEAERCAFRGGSWFGGARFGVFALGFDAPRSRSNYYFGGRPAFAELETD